MPVYWSMLLFVGVIALLEQMQISSKGTVQKSKEYKTPYIYAVLIFLYITLLCGFRDVVLDTGAYIASFEEMPTTWSLMFEKVSKIENGKLFYYICGIFKIVVSESHYAWLLFLAGISCYCILKGLYNYSIDFPLSAYLFIATTNFTWLINGTRQFLVVAILFANSKWLIEGKKWKYILLAFFLTFIHSSAIFVIPVCIFASSKKILDEKIIVFAILTVIGTKYSEEVFKFLNIFMEKDYTDSLAASGGSNMMRLLIAAVPIIIVLMAYKYAKANATPAICLGINMSFIGACFYFASTFTNGILIGRMPIYFSLYNLYLLPWLLKECFDDRSRKIAKFSCIALYLVYFYYQMVVTWHGLTYVSYILNFNYL